MQNQYSFAHQQIRIVYFSYFNAAQRSLYKLKAKCPSVVAKGVIQSQWRTQRCHLHQSWNSWRQYLNGHEKSPRNQGVSRSLLTVKLVSQQLAKMCSAHQALAEGSSGSKEKVEELKVKVEEIEVCAGLTLSSLPNQYPRHNRRNWRMR